MSVLTKLRLMVLSQRYRVSGPSREARLDQPCAKTGAMSM
jgi:hypothetical protein